MKKSLFTEVQIKGVLGQAEGGLPVPELCGRVRRKLVEPGRAASWTLAMPKHDPFKHFHSSREIIRLAVMMYVRFPLSLRNVEDLLHERGIDISHETVRFWWNRFGPMLPRSSPPP